MASEVYQIKHGNWRSVVNTLLEAAQPFKNLVEGRTILIKPNLVTKDLPPITTPVELVEAILQYIRGIGLKNPVIVGEGCGATEYETEEVFEELGYHDLATQYNITLLDLNKAPLVELTKDTCKRWPVMRLPKIVMNSFLFSVPVLKAHSLAEVTLTMKNMMGCAPPKHYNAGSWKKSAFHQGMQEAIFDLNQHRTPDFTLLDASVGMSEAHLWGPECQPPVNLLLASHDPVAIDAYGAKLLKRNWEQIEYIVFAHGILGQADPIDVLTLT